MKSPRALKITLLVLAAAAVTTAAYFLPLLDWIAAAQVRIEAFGAWGPLLYVLLYIVFTLCLIPGSALTFTAGVLYGVQRGTLISLSASTLAACLAFLVSRYLARERLLRRFDKSPHFHALDRAVARNAWKIVILMRLSPAFPYVLLNYAFGLTRVSFPIFAVCSLVGMIPATLLLVSAAAALGEAADTAAKELKATGGGRAPAALIVRRDLAEGDFQEVVTYLRNRQLVLWSESEAEERQEQERLAEQVAWLEDAVREGKAKVGPREGEATDVAKERALKALRAARHEAREAFRQMDAGRAGSARERQKEAAAYLLEARGDRKKVNWLLWSSLGVSLLVTIVVSRIASQALKEGNRETQRMANPPPPSGHEGN